MTKQAYLQQHGMVMKLTMAKESSQHVWINYNNLDKMEYHVNTLPGTFYSKSRARLRHVRELHNCKNGHGWVEHNYIYKTSLLNIPKRIMDLTIDTWIHGIKITAEKRTWQNPKSLKTATSRSLVCMLVLVTSQITKIQYKHPCKDGMVQFKTHVDLMPI